MHWYRAKGIRRLFKLNSIHPTLTIINTLCNTGSVLFKSAIPFTICPPWFIKASFLQSVYESWLEQPTGSRADSSEALWVHLIYILAYRLRLPQPKSSATAGWRCYAAIGLIMDGWMDWFIDWLIEWLDEWLNRWN